MVWKKKDKLVFIPKNTLTNLQDLFSHLLEADPNPGVWSKNNENNKNALSIYLLGTKTTKTVQG